jgi:hypothetical protein
MKELRTKQGENHSEIKGEIKDLKDNLLTRVAALENDRLSKIDFTNYDATRIQPIITNVDALMKFRYILAGIILAASVIAPIVWQITSYYLLKMK